jgi:TolB protein
MWFAATYGDPATRGGGSNVPAWMPDGTILFPRRAPGSKVAWDYQAGRPDADHFNRDYRPELARGGTDIRRLDPADGSQVSLTGAREGRWDFRAVPSAGGRLIAFCRAETGKPPGLWVMRADGSAQRLLTSGIEGRGADHPRWVEGPAAGA